MKTISKYKNIIIVGTNYSLLIALLLLKMEDCYIFLANNLKCNIENSILKNNIYNTNLYLKKKGIFGILNYYYNFMLYFYKVKKYKNTRTNFYVNSCLREIGILSKYNLLEDGTVDYKIAEHSKFSLKNILKLDFRRNVFNKIKKIYLTGLAPIPEEIRDKVEIIDLRELWNKKSDIEKKEILNVFGFDRRIVNSIKNKKYILYTQPLSEDKVLLEDEKIELYSKILKNYDKNNVILKKHPREKTNYKKNFPDIEVINQVFPAELLSFLDIHFEKAITIFSTAALTDKKGNVDFYGTEIHPKLLKKFGSQDNIMKRNAFLDEKEKK